MSRIIRVIIQNSLHQNKNREKVKNREIRYLPDLSIFNYVLVQRILNYYPNYPSHRLYFGEVKHLIHYQDLGIFHAKFCLYIIRYSHSQTCGHKLKNFQIIEKHSILYNLKNFLHIMT